MRYTGNYNLKKPEGTDTVNIEDFNDNADIIDAELKKLNDAIKDLDADGITLPDGKTISEKFEEITEEVGNIQELNTDEKANIVAAINEIYQALLTHQQNINQEIGQVASDLAAHKAENASQHGDLTTLKTSQKSSLVEAINELFTNVSNGKQLVGRAITDVDDSIIIPTDPTFQELANAIEKISTGKKWAKGRVYGNITSVSGLDFKPKRIFISTTGALVSNPYYSVYYYDVESGIDVQVYTSPGTGTHGKRSTLIVINNNGFSCSRLSDYVDYYDWFATD